MQQNIDNPFLKVTGGLSLQHEPSQICNCDYVPQSAKYSDFLSVKLTPNSLKISNFILKSLYIEVRLNSANKQDYKLHTTVYHPEVKNLTTVRIVTLKLTDATQFPKSSVSTPEFHMICCTQIAN